MNVDVTSVSRKEQKLSKVPAAIYVINEEMIEHSGATNIPDLLRMAPGVQVAQVDANRWAISVRGFNDIYSNKLLVLVDGRTVYTPTFSGVYWDQLDIPLDTIERIEVVRGAGGAVWGANAMNGVINIITKHSKDTKGGSFTAGGGNAQTSDFEARGGGKLGPIGTYRAFADFGSFANRILDTQSSGHDGWNRTHAGFRADISRTAKDTFYLEGNGLRSSGYQTLAPNPLDPRAFSAQAVDQYEYDVTGHWTHRHSDNSTSALQIYENGYSRRDSGLTETANTLDFDFQNQTRLNSRNDLVWGAGYRFTSDALRNSYDPISTFSMLGYYAQFRPNHLSYNLFSTFLQDEVALTSNLSLTLGTKLEHNAFSGFEVEPTARLAYSLGESSTLWAATSRAVRQPSRLETSMIVDSPQYPVAPNTDFQVQIEGSKVIRAETVLDNEVGYRVMPASNLSFDLTGFYNTYSDLQTSRILPFRFDVSEEQQHVQLPVQYINGGSAISRGAEVSTQWRIVPRWTLNGSYSYLHTSLSTAPSLGGGALAIPGFTSLLTSFQSGSTALNSVVQSAPSQQAGLQSFWSVTPKLSFDNDVFYVGQVAGWQIAAYTRLDLHARYQWNRHTTLSVSGQNLLSPNHLESGRLEQVVRTQVPRSIFGRVVWTF